MGRIEEGRGKVSGRLAPPPGLRSVVADAGHPIPVHRYLQTGRTGAMVIAGEMFWRRLRALATRRSAGTTVEYAVMLSLIVFLVAGAIVAFSAGTASMSERVTHMVLSVTMDDSTLPTGRLSHSSSGVGTQRRPNRDGGWRGD